MLGNEYPGDRLISAVRAGTLEEVTELINSCGFSCSKAWPAAYYLLCDAIENKHSAVAKLILTKSSVVNIESGYHDTPLHFAVINGDVELVKVLLEYGANVDAENKDKQTPFQNAIDNRKMEIVKLFLINKEPNTPLHFAARIGNIEVVRWLLDDGSDINAKNRCGETPLQNAISDKQMEITELLLNRKADVHMRDNEGTSSLHIAVENGCLHIVERLLKAGASVNSASNAKFKEGYTPLCIAAFKGDEEITQLLLSRGAEVNVKMVDGETPLHIAVGEGHLQVVEDLLKHGADVNSECSLGGANRSYTPLRRAIWQQHEEVIELLLKYGANVDAQIEGGDTILQAAVESENPIIVDCILEYCPDMNNEGNRSAFNTAVCDYGKEYPQIVENMLQYGFSVTPDIINYFYLFLHDAVGKGYFKIVEELLKHGEDGNNLLHIAIKHKQKEITKLLIRYGADVNIKDKTGRTPIFYATENGDLKMIELLLSHRANVKDDSKLLITAVKSEHIETKEEITKLLLSSGANVNSDTVLHAAAATGHVKIIAALLKYNADVNSTIQNYITPLHISAQEGNAIIIKMLLSRGAKVNAKQEDGTTALHIATRAGHEEVVEVLLRCGAEVDSLHIAAENNYPKVVKILLKFGANIDSIDKFGRTALHIAAKEGHQKVVIDLLNHSCDINIENNKYQTPLDCAEAGIGSFSNMHANDYNCATRRYRNDTSVYVRGMYACKRIVKILKRHIVLMRTANFYLNERNIHSISNSNELGDVWNECKKEIEYMKSEKITNTNVSYYDILTKDSDRLAMYARNENIVRVFQSDHLEAKFPIYVNMIKSSFKKGKIRKQLLEQSKKCFRILLNKIPELPSNCTEKIFRYLSDEDLKILISALGRKELLEQGYRLFYFLLNDFPDFSYDCTEKIFSYLGDDDLRILIEACKPTNISSPNIDNCDVAITSNTKRKTRKRKRNRN